MKYVDVIAQDKLLFVAAVALSIAVLWPASNAASAFWALLALMALCGREIQMEIRKSNTVIHAPRFYYGGVELADRITDLCKKDEAKTDQPEPPAA